ncbi:N-acetyltransferase family protein [Streptomyces lydicus]
MIRIRDASKDDGPRLMELHGLVHGLHAQQRPDVFVAEPEQTRLEEFFHDACDDASAHVLVAELSSGSSLAGYAMARVVEREGSPQVKMHSVVMLQQLTVDPDASRGGVGTALLEAVREIGRETGCRRLITNVWCFNTPARSFYEASGLVPMTQQLEQKL